MFMALDIESAELLEPLKHALKAALKETLGELNGEVENCFLFFHDACEQLLLEQKIKFQKRNARLDKMHGKIATTENPFPVSDDVDQLSSDEFDWWYPKYTKLKKEFIDRLIHSL